MDCLQRATYSYRLGADVPLTCLDVNGTDKDSGSASKGSNKVIPTFYQMGANRDKAIKCGCFLPSDGSIAFERERTVFATRTSCWSSKI